MENIFKKIDAINCIVDSFQSKLLTIHDVDFYDHICEQLKIEVLNFFPKSRTAIDLWSCFDFSRLNLFSVILYDNPDVLEKGSIIGTISEDANFILIDNFIVIEGHSGNTEFLSFEKFLDFIEALIYLSAANYAHELTNELFKERLLNIDQSKSYVDAINFYFSAMVNY